MIHPIRPTHWRKIRWGQAIWSQALVFRVGFGVIEALLLGLASDGSALDSLPISALDELANTAILVTGLAPLVERLSMIFTHIFAYVLIFHAISSREAKWGGLAILYKTPLNAPGGFAAFLGTNTLEKIWTLEAFVAIFRNRTRF